MIYASIKRFWRERWYELSKASWRSVWVLDKGELERWLLDGDCDRVGESLRIDYNGVGNLFKIDCEDICDLFDKERPRPRSRTESEDKILENVLSWIISSSLMLANNVLLAATEL